MMLVMTPTERLAALLDAEAAGRPIEILAFYGHQPSADAPLSSGCLSQWWPRPFTVDGFTYPTAEHWMMAGKARLFGDDDALAAILATPDPRAAKTAGRRVRGFEEARWYAAGYTIVVRGNLAKFSQHEDLRNYLLATGRRVIVEASPNDRIWGVGLARDHLDIVVPSRWRGLNQLGFALMGCGTASSTVRSCSEQLPRFARTVRPAGRR
jgi:ribA/ribD-fused uncharacterized protein